MLAQSAAVLGISFSNQQFDAPGTQRLADLGFRVVRAVGISFLGALSSFAAFPLNRPDAVDQWDRYLRVVDDFSADISPPHSGIGQAVYT